MVPPHSYPTEIALFVTATQHVPPNLFSELHEAATNEMLDEGLSLHIFTDDGQGHDFKGWSNDRLAFWAMQQFESNDSKLAREAIVVLDDEGVAQQYVHIVGLDLDRVDHFLTAQRSQALMGGEVLEGLVTDTFKAGFKYALLIPYLIDSGWKGIEDYKEYAEERGGILRSMDGSDSEEPQSLASNSGFSDAGDSATGENDMAVPQPVYKTSSNDLVVSFGHVEIGDPVWDIVHGPQIITEKVHDDHSVYWEEQNAKLKAADIPVETTIEALNC